MGIQSYRRPRIGLLQSHGALCHGDSGKRGAGVLCIQYTQSLLNNPNVLLQNEAM